MVVKGRKNDCVFDPLACHFHFALQIVFSQWEGGELGPKVLC
jgi:hypothetical protein